MLNRIYAFFGIRTQASRQQQRNRLACRLKYVHNMDLAEAFGSEFYNAVIEAKRTIANGQKQVQNRTDNK